MIKGTPSPWLNMSLEQLKEMKDRYKLMNDLTEQQAREEKILKEQEKQNASTQMDAMKDTLPFLDTQG